MAALKTAKNDYWATEVEEQRLSVAAWIAFAQDRREEALRLIRSKPPTLEDASEKDPVSPGRINFRRVNFSVICSSRAGVQKRRTCRLRDRL